MCFSATKKLQLSQFWFHNAFCGKSHVLSAVLQAAWLGDNISALVYRVHVRVSKEGPLFVSQVKKLGQVAPKALLLQNGWEREGFRKRLGR